MRRPVRAQWAQGINTRSEYGRVPARAYCRVAGLPGVIPRRVPPVGGRVLFLLQITRVEYVQITVHVERAVRPCRDGGTLPLAVLSCGPLRRGEDGSHSVAGDEDSEYGHPAQADTREDMEAVVGQWPGEVCGACWAEWQRPDDDV